MTAPDSIPTGILGLGLIGSIWARHLHDDGWLAASWNRTPRPHAPKRVDTPADVARAARACILCVSDPPAVDTVLAAMEPALGADHLVIQCSTIDPRSSVAFEARVRARGALYVEAPFSGSKPGAETRRNVFYLGGAAPALARASRVLSRLSHELITVGTAPQAALIKLASNLQIAAQTESLCEALAWARAAGITDETFFRVMRGNMAWSGVHGIKEPKLRARDFSPQFATAHMLKDLRLAIDSAASPMPVTAAVAKQLAEAVRRGYGPDDFAGLIRLFDDPIAD